MGGFDTFNKARNISAVVLPLRLYVVLAINVFCQINSLKPRAFSTAANVFSSSGEKVVGA